MFRDNRVKLRPKMLFSSLVLNGVINIEKMVMGCGTNGELTDARGVS